MSEPLVPRSLWSDHVSAVRREHNGFDAVQLPAVNTSQEGITPLSSSYKSVESKFILADPEGKQTPQASVGHASGEASNGAQIHSTDPVTVGNTDSNRLPTVKKPFIDLSPVVVEVRTSPNRRRSCSEHH